MSRPFRDDLNQNPYDYTVKVRNIFKGLDLIECLKNYGQRFVTLFRGQWSKLFPRKRNVKRQNGCLRRPYKLLRKEEKLKAMEKRKDIPIWMQSSKEEQKKKKNQCKEIEENNRTGKTRDLFKKIRDTNGTFLAKMDTKKDRNCMDLTSRRY